MVRLFSAFLLRCPHCKQGNLFTDNNILHLGSLAEMPDKCTVCGQDFQIEEGFYYGAMFISYIFLAFLMFGIIGLKILFTGYVSTIELIIILGLVMLFWPYWFRLARSLWLMLYYKTHSTLDVPPDKD